MLKPLCRVCAPLVAVLSLTLGAAAAGPPPPTTRPAAEGAPAAKAAGRRPYVQSGPDGVFYARGVLPKDGGFSGPHTDVYRVEGEGEREQDKLVDRYGWFAEGGLVLGWSPVKGEVAVMAAINGTADNWRRQVELRFSMGGRHLKTYTSGDLIALGADEQVSTDPRRRHAGFRMVGCEQVPGTNEYDFVVEVARGRQLRFDITTGEPRPAADRAGPGGSGATAGTRESFKGWELYVWQHEGETFCSLLAGTNRLKSADEIGGAAARGVDRVKAQLAELKAGQYVTIRGRKAGEEPPQPAARELADYCKTVGLRAQ